MSFLLGANQSLVDEFNAALETNERISEELEQWLKYHFAKQLGADIKDVQADSKLTPDAPTDKIFDDQLKLVKRLLSPIRSIPAEILSLIFIQVKNNRPVRTIPISRLTDEFSCWQLGHVCSAWRAVLLDTHELWSALSLTLDSELDSVDQKLLDITKEALSRTGDRLISVEICDSSFTHAVTPTAKSLCAVFRPYIGKLEELDLCAPFCIVNLMDVPWKSLTRLQCNPGYFNTRDYTQERTLDAPKLRELQLRHCSKRSYTLHFFRYTARNLTSLYLGQHIQFQNPHCLDVLRECLKLEKLRCCIDRDPNSLDSCPFVHLPTLRVLGVEIDVDPVHPFRLKFLGRLTLPALRRLSIHGFEKSWLLEPEVIPMITRSACSLRGVVVGKMGDEAQFPKFLRLTPDLEVLLAEEWDWRPEFMSGMTSGMLLPKIERLSCCLLFDFEDDFWNMLSKRTLLAPPGGLVTLNNVEVSVQVRAEFLERWSSRITELEAAQVNFTVLAPFDEETLMSPTSSVRNLTLL